MAKQAVRIDEIYRGSGGGNTANALPQTGIRMLQIENDREVRRKNDEKDAIWIANSPATLAIQMGAVARTNWLG